MTSVTTLSPLHNDNTSQTSYNIFSGNSKEPFQITYTIPENEKPSRFDTVTLVANDQVLEVKVTIVSGPTSMSTGYVVSEVSRLYLEIVVNQYFDVVDYTYFLPMIGIFMGTIIYAYFFHQLLIDLCHYFVNFQHKSMRQYLKIFHC